MSTALSSLIGSLRLGDPMSDGGLAAVPLFGRWEAIPEFVTLEEAITSCRLAVTEISEGGAVPLLKARNSGPVGVLILDGEELAGAKQNRVLNTSVFIKPGQETTIPVSCTEAGRWSYRSRSFGDSGYIAAPAIRVAANRSVTTNVRRGGSYHSDQGKVWEEVSLLQQRHKLASPTSAARDVYEVRKEEVEHRLASFPCLPGQIGLLALWSGRVAGMDIVANDKAYAKLHSRLLWSYALDAPPGSDAHASSSTDHLRRAAQEWLAALAQVPITEHESPGNGVSYRFTGRGLVGSALAVDGAVLHAVALATQAGLEADESRYPGFFERRAHFPW
jgi:hypothetical protein